MEQSDMFRRYLEPLHSHLKSIVTPESGELEISERKPPFYSPQQAEERWKKVHEHNQTCRLDGGDHRTEKDA